MSRFSNNSDARYEVTEAEEGNIVIDVYAEDMQVVNMTIHYHDADEGGLKKTLQVPAGRRT